MEGYRKIPDDDKFLAKRFLLPELADEWTDYQPDHVLGLGGEGIVGRFSRTKRGKTEVHRLRTQYIAVKECREWRNRDVPIPVEVRQLKRLKHAKCKAIVKIKKWYAYREDQKYRIYLEYCPHGDLGRLIYRHRRFGRYLPEPFLWNLFHHLAQALMVLERGSLSKKNQSEAWVPIVHNDIKPSNIFLGDEDHGTFSFYPTAKLGDFGSSFQRVPNPSKAKHAHGTPGYNAPDKVEGPWSNIYQVGTCLFEAATLESWSQKPGRGRSEDDRRKFQWRCGGVTPISKRLELLILKCLAEDPDDRPTVDQLLRETRDGLLEIRNEEERGRGIESGPYLAAKKYEAREPPNNYPHTLYYKGSDVQYAPFGLYQPSSTFPPDTLGTYFPEFFGDNLDPLLFPGKDDALRHLARTGSDAIHLELQDRRMPWETDSDFAARYRDWPQDYVTGHDNDDPLWDQEQPLSVCNDGINPWALNRGHFQELMEEERFSLRSIVKNEKQAEARAKRAETARIQARFNRTRFAELKKLWPNLSEDKIYQKWPEYKPDDKSTDVSEDLSEEGSSDGSL